MAADELDGPRPGGRSARPVGEVVQTAIDWFTTDRSHTRPDPDGAVVPGQLLGSARFEILVSRLLTGAPAEQARALVHAQADWLISRMPHEHTPLSLDSAQQAGRAWGILITPDDTQALPDQDVLTEVAARTGISGRTADEIRTQAYQTSAAYNRADLLFPYDSAPDEVLIRDWNRLAACGPELPDAATRAQDVLELLTARITGTEEHDWMAAAAQHAAQVYASIVHAQPLLASAASVIPSRGRPNAEGELARLVELNQEGHLAAAATAAARATAVQEWVNPDGTAAPDRIRTVEAAAPGTRTLLRLNETLATLDPGPGSTAFTALDPQRIAQIVEGIGQLSAKMSTVMRTTNTAGATTGEQPTPQRRQHQHPPNSDQSSGGSTRKGVA
ncbi:hypothetical protein ACWF9B_00720 [Streptomyces sp. NPDC055089]